MIPVIEVESLIISSTGEIITTTSTGNKLGLDVNVISGTMEGIGAGYNLRYEELTENISLVNGSYLQVYSTSVTGKIHSMVMRFNNNNVDIKMTVDSITVLNGINLRNIYNNYRLNSGGFASGQLPRFIYSYDQGRGIVFEFPGALIFNTEFKIEIRANGSNYRLRRGLVVRSET